jgi:fatty-acyl-CoA synthase
VILFTGGTTGTQKGVMLSHENIFWNTVQLVIDTEMHEDDVTVLATPLHHAGALIIWLIPHLYLGATAVVLPKYSPEALIDAIASERVTNGWTPPSMTRDVLTHPLARQRDLSSFVRWYVAGGPFPRRDREAMKALLPGVKIFYQYGLTEAGVMVTVLKDKDYERAPDSIGRAFLHCDVKILREDLSDAALGEVGEIAVRSPSVMKGYYDAPDATKATFHDGWLRTGDMGAIDAEGYVRFHDRLKDMVKTGGFNVYSQEVEQVLLRHPSLREVAVIGLPSDKWGEEVVAVVVLRDGEVADDESILAFARDHLAKYKVPKQIHFLDYGDLPINYSGKIIKKELRKRFPSLA